RKIAPSMWPASYSSRPFRAGSMYQRTSATRTDGSCRWRKSQSVVTRESIALLLLAEPGHRRFDLLVVRGDRPGARGDGPLLDLRDLLAGHGGLAHDRHRGGASEREALHVLHLFLHLVHPLGHRSRGRHHALHAVREVLVGLPELRRELHLLGHALL